MGFLDGTGRAQRHLGVHLVEVLVDDRRLDHRHAVVHQRGHHAIGVEPQLLEVAAAQQIGMLRKWRLDKAQLFGIHPVELEPLPEGDRQQRAQPRHAHFLADAVLRAADARPGPGQQTQLGAGLGQHSAAANHHLLQAAVHRLQIPDGRGPAQLQRAGLNARDEGRVQRDELPRQVEPAAGKKPSSVATKTVAKSDTAE